MKLAAVALALILAQAGPAIALPQASNWIIGQWSCRVGLQNASMSWRYPIVSCADNCNSTAAKPNGTLRVTGGPLIRLAYTSGDATQFSYRHPEGLIVHMRRISSSPEVMQGAYPAGEGSVGVRCTKSAGPQFSIPQ